MPCCFLIFKYVRYHSSAILYYANFQVDMLLWHTKTNTLDLYVVACCKYVALIFNKEMNVSYRHTCVKI